MSKRGNQRLANRVIREQKAAERRRKRSLRVSAIAAGVLALVSLGGYAVYANMDSGAHQVPQHANAAGTAITEGSGPVKVEIYQDYLCPACKAFDAAAKARLDQLVQENKITLSTHPIAILDRMSTNSYSTRSAAAAGCAADGDRFAAFSDALYERQPAEGGAGYTDEELIGIGRQTGLGDAFATCVREGTYGTWPAFTTDEASRRGVTGTPTIYVNDRKVAPAAGQSLADAVVAAISGAS